MCGNVFELFVRSPYLCGSWLSDVDTLNGAKQPSYTSELKYTGIPRGGQTSHDSKVKRLKKFSG